MGIAGRSAWRRAGAGPSEAEAAAEAARAAAAKRKRRLRYAAIAARGLFGGALRRHLALAEDAAAPSRPARPRRRAAS